MTRPLVRWSNRTIPVRHHQGVVIGQAYDARAQLDVPGALGGGGDEELRRGDGLPAGAVVLADPRLVKAEVVQPLNQLQVPLQAQSRVLAEPVEGRKEDTEFHAGRECHGVIPSSPPTADAWPAMGVCSTTGGASPRHSSTRDSGEQLTGTPQIPHLRLLGWLLWAYSRCGVSTGVLIGLCAASLRGLATVSHQLWSLSG